MSRFITAADRYIFRLTIVPMVGVFVLSLTVVESYTIERDAALQPGESLQLGRYAYRFDGIKPGFNSRHPLQDFLDVGAKLCTDCGCVARPDRL